MRRVIQALRRSFPLIACAVLAASAPAGEASIPEGRALAVTASTRVAPGEYVRPALGEAGRGGVIVAEGLTGATLDLTGVIVRGVEKTGDRGAARGYGLVLRKARDVRVVGGSFSGYKVCVLLEDCVDVTLEGVACESYFAERLSSTAVASDGADRLERGEAGDPRWIDAGGAAIALVRCEKCTVSGARARRGRNGIVLVESHGCRVFDCDLAFLSGFGVALWASGANVIANNRAELIARGSPGGAWRGGMGSCGILLAGGCSDNRVAENSVARCGTGIAVIGAGGSGRNRIFRNDASWTVEDGFELVRSGDERLQENIARGCGRNAVSATECDRLLVSSSQLEGAHAAGVSIHGGERIAVIRNLLRDCGSGLELAALASAPGAAPDDRAALGDAFVFDNAFAGNATDFVMEKVAGLRVGENVFAPQPSELVVRNSTARGAEAEAPDEFKARLKGVGGFLPSGRMSDCGLVALAAEEAQEVDQVLDAPDVALPGTSAPCKRTAALEHAELVLGAFGPWDFENRETRPPARAPGGALAMVRWQARWFSWKSGPDPRAGEQALAGWRELAAEPLVRQAVGVWTSPLPDQEVADALGTDRFGMTAVARATFEPGRYRLSVVSDDGVRVRLDGATVLENWTWHGPTRDSADLDIGPGEHELVLEYFQVDGGNALALELDRLEP